jgi:hypothetical protein
VRARGVAGNCSVTVTSARSGSTPSPGDSERAVSTDHAPDLPSSTDDFTDLDSANDVAPASAATQCSSTTVARCRPTDLRRPRPASPARH